MQILLDMTKKQIVKPQIGPIRVRTDMTSADNQTALLEELKQFCESSIQSTDATLARLGWTRQHLLAKTKHKVVCPFDSNHVIPAESLEKHRTYCWLKHIGVPKEEWDQCQSSDAFYEEHAQSVHQVKIDKVLQNKILKKYCFDHGIPIGPDKDVPATPEQSVIELQVHERLALYEYVISEAKKAGKPTSEKMDEQLLFDFTKGKKDNNDHSLSSLQLIAQQRDDRRRRQTYRAKNVHTTKKSYTEVIREVIQSQVEQLEKKLKASQPSTSSTRDSAHHDQSKTKLRKGPSSIKFNEDMVHREQSEEQIQSDPLISRTNREEQSTVLSPDPTHGMDRREENDGTRTGNRDYDSSAPGSSRRRRRRSDDSDCDTSHDKHRHKSHKHRKSKRSHKHKLDESSDRALE